MTVDSLACLWIWKFCVVHTLSSSSDWAKMGTLVSSLLATASSMNVVPLSLKLVDFLFKFCWVFQPEYPHGFNQFFDSFQFKIYRLAYWKKASPTVCEIGRLFGLRWMRRKVIRYNGLLFLFSIAVFFQAFHLVFSCIVIILCNSISHKNIFSKWCFVALIVGVTSSMVLSICYAVLRLLFCDGDLVFDAHAARPVYWSYLCICILHLHKLVATYIGTYAMPRYQPSPSKLCRLLWQCSYLAKTSFSAHVPVFSASQNITNVTCGYLVRAWRVYPSL